MYTWLVNNHKQLKTIDNYIAARYALYIELRYIEVRTKNGEKCKRYHMDAHTRKVYVPMTETGFYILLCLREPNHGYGIVQKVKELTDGRDCACTRNHVR